MAENKIAIPACKKCTKKTGQLSFFIPSFTFGVMSSGIVKGNLVPVFNNMSPVWACPQCGDRLYITMETADAWIVTWANVFMNLETCMTKVANIEENGVTEVVFQRKDGTN